MPTPETLLLKQKSRFMTNPEQKKTTIKAKRRLTADPDMSVADIMECFEKWFGKRGSRDVSGMLEVAKQTSSWKTAPSAAVLDGVNDLFVELAQKAPNTALAPTKVILALKLLHS